MLKKTKNKGITLIALVITIIVLLILAAISISMLTGDNSIIKNAVKAKESSEISEEKEIVEKATVQAMGKNKYGSIIEKELKNELDNITGYGKTKILPNEDTLLVNFIEKNRWYIVKKDGNVDEFEYILDNTPGDITKDKDGNALDGVEKPFEIWSIEDLVVFSNLTRGSGYKLIDGQAIQITSTNNFSGKKVVLKKNLDFKSEISYIDSERTDFGDLNSNAEDQNKLMSEMTSGTGFRPISNFNGSFDGENHEIRNVYINSNQNAALFVGYQIKEIKNLGITGNITSTAGQVAGIFVSSTLINNKCELINNCWNKADITGGTSTSWAAGICARDVSKITNCYNTGNITNTVNNTGSAAGISSQLGGNEIEFCYNTGDIKGKQYVGGIASGHNNKTNITNCYNKGNISGETSVGGILGTNASSIENSYNIGSISAVGNGRVGGIVGGNATNIMNCYNTGDLDGNYISGICDALEGKILNCYSTGKMLSTNNAGGSGLVITCKAGASGIYNSFHIGDVPGNPWNYSSGIIQTNKSEVDMINCYSSGEFIAYYRDNPYAYSPYGLVAINSGIININKCYYVKTEHVNTAIKDMEDNLELVIKLNNLSELTAQILNNNRTTLTHTEEWREWVDGNDGYPILKFELDEKGFIK